MNAKTSALVAAVGSLFVLSMSAQAGPVEVKAGMEKCYGVAKAGKNDCAGAAHSCAGQSKVQSAKEWISLPSGTCERLVGGSVTAPK